MTKSAKVEYGEGTIEALAEMGIDVEKEVNRALAKDYIIQLAEQAGWMMGDEPEEFNTRLQKFAELIIKECANSESGEFNKRLEKFADLIVKECANFLRDTLDDDFAAEQLEEHFGVE